MAIPTAAIWEMRATATANNVNGAFFNAARGGVDYSQQNAAQINGTDGASAGVSTTFTSAAQTFTSQMLGNGLHITAGTTVTTGWYEIVAFTDAHTVTLDRNIGNGATGCTFFVGGAANFGALDDPFLESLVAGNKLWIKSGTYTIGGAVNITTGVGTATSMIEIEGYNATRGDAPTGTNRPLLACGANAFAIGSFTKSSHLRVTTTATSGYQPGTSNRVINVAAINSSTTANRVAIQPGTPCYLLNVEAVSYRGPAMAVSSGSAHMEGCVFHDSDVGVGITTSAATFISKCLFYNNVTAGTRSTSAATGFHITGCTFYGAESKMGKGIDFATGTTNAVVTNNIFYGLTTGVTHADTQTLGFDDYNDYYNNTADVSAAGQWQKGAHDLALDPGFSSVAQLTGATATTSGSVLTQSGGDFSTVVDGRDYLRLVSGTGITAGIYGITSHTSTTVTLDIAPGTSATADKVWQITTGRNFAIGPNLKAQGFPGAFQNGTTTGYIDIGGVQRQESGAASPSLRGSFQN